MAATQFVVRNDAGVVNRGVTGGNGLALPIGASAGSDISLNLNQSEIMSYGRVGSGLEITLTDGQIIVIDNYFSASGAPLSELFLSTDGLLTQVELAPGQGGLYYSTYVDQDSYGKYTADTDLYFTPGQNVVVAAPAGAIVDDQVGMLSAVPLLGGLGLWPLLGAAGAAAAIPAVLGGGGERVTPDPVAIEILTGTLEAGHIINAEDRKDGIEITGTGTVGADVVVTIDEQEQTTTVDEDGNWGVHFTRGQIDEGTYVEGVSAILTRGDDSVTVTGEISVDTEATVTFDEDSVGSDGTVNAEEQSGEVTLTGTTDVDSTVIVRIKGVDYEATVDGTAWVCSLPAGALMTGEFVQNVRVTATDTVGNTAVVRGDFVVDTVTTVTLDSNDFGGDSVLNFVERDGGVTLTGTAESGASVVVSIEGVSRTVTATTEGTWSAEWALVDLPGGNIEMSATVTVTATDFAGNSASASGSIDIDTFVNILTLTSVPVAGDDVINFNEHGQAIDLSGQVEAGSTVTVTIEGVTRTAAVTATGEWSVSFEGGSLAVGEYDTDIVVNATDAAGNTASLSHGVRVDTVAGDVTLSPDPIEIDDIVNAVEVTDGVMISGTATAGLTVTVTLGAASHQVVAEADGSWQSLFLNTEVPGGTYDADITASITDDAGNFKSVSDTVHIDTELSVTINAPVEGDNIISGAEATDGVTFTGATEPGATVSVTFAGVSRAVTADVTGNWTAGYSSSEIPAGESDQTVTASVTDRAGNTANASHDFQVDTIVDPLTTQGPVEGDGIVNRAEAADGIELTGLVEIGSTVEVSFGGQSYAANVTAAGGWSVVIPAADVAPGEYQATASITATDHVGNIRTIDETFAVDTAPPVAPLIESYRVTGQGAVREMTTELTDENIAIHSLSGNAAAIDVTPTPEVDTEFNETSFAFRPAINPGTHLVMTASDDAANATSTLFVVDETGTNAVDIDRANLDGFEIEGIDLQFAEDSELTINAEQLEALSQHSNMVTIHGGADDTVTIAGATAAAETSTIGGRAYSHYTLGDNGGTLIIDDEINVVT